MRQQEQPASWPHCESTAACDRWAWRDGWKSSTVISPHAAEATTTKMSMILAGTRKNRGKFPFSGNWAIGHPLFLALGDDAGTQLH